MLCRAHPVSAHEDVHPAFKELQALWDGKTHAMFLTEARKSQTLLHNSSRLSSYVCHVTFRSPNFDPLKVRYLVCAKYHNFSIIKRRHGNSHRAIDLSDSCFGVSCPGTVLSFSLHWPCPGSVSLGRTET